jgi:hypothetical protein
MLCHIAIDAGHWSTAVQYLELKMLSRILSEFLQVENAK